MQSDLDMVVCPRNSTLVWLLTNLKWIISLRQSSNNVLMLTGWGSALFSQAVLGHAWLRSRSACSTWETPGRHTTSPFGYIGRVAASDDPSLWCYATARIRHSNFNGRWSTSVSFWIEATNVLFLHRLNVSLAAEKIVMIRLMSCPVSRLYKYWATVATDNSKIAGHDTFYMKCSFAPIKVSTPII